VMMEQHIKIDLAAQGWYGTTPPPPPRTLPDAAQLLTASRQGGQATASPPSISSFCRSQMSGGKVVSAPCGKSGAPLTPYAPCAQVFAKGRRLGQGPLPAKVRVRTPQVHGREAPQDPRGLFRAGRVAVPATAHSLSAADGCVRR
jgi:hypothetical protein